jgi:flagellar basal-body rod modification protein FlgD
MSVTAVNLYSSQSGSSTSEVSSSMFTDPDQFLQLLLAQLTNQNPLEPLDDSEMMAQVAQLSSLQELQKVNDHLEEMSYSNAFNSAISLVGKVAEVMLNNGETYEGRIDGFSFIDGIAYLQIDSYSVTLSSILSVHEYEEGETSL